jgi:hypothetical protein
MRPTACCRHLPRSGNWYRNAKDGSLNHAYPAELGVRDFGPESFGLSARARLQEQRACRAIGTSAGFCELCSGN